MTRKLEIISKLSFLKNSNLNSNFLKVFNGNRLFCYLKPIQENFPNLNYNICYLLSKWRIENPTISTGVFQVTEARTKKWLTELVINREDRVIFMIHDLNHEPIGHIGFSNIDFEKNTVELDSVLRGKKNTLKGLMSLCVNRIIEFGFKELKFSEIDLSVFSDNTHAIDFYEKLNFNIIYKTPLIKVIKKDEIKYEEVKMTKNQKIDKFYLKMRYQKTTK
jgi:RimJ/RimL family protein N-acetyltransferase